MLAVIAVLCAGMFAIPAMASAAAPQLSLEQAAGQSDPTNNSSIDFTLSSDIALDVASVEMSDFDATNGTVASVSGSGTEFTVTVNAGSDGVVTIDESGTFEVKDDASVDTQADIAGGTDRSVTYDGTSPVVSLQVAAGQDNPTDQPVIEFELSSDEDLDPASVTAGDFSVDNGTVDSVNGATDTYTVQVTADTPNADVTLSASGTFEVADLSGNTQASTTGADPTVLYDTAPTLTLEQNVGQDDPTNNSGIEFSLSGNEDLDSGSVDASDFDITNGTFDSVSGTGSDLVVLTTATADGDVVIAPSGTFSVEDTNGNATTTAGGTDRTVTYDTTPPTTSFDVNPTNPSYDRTPYFEYSSDEDATYECRLWEEGASLPSYDSCDSSFQSALLDEGDYHFEVRGTDDSGNVESGVMFSWSIIPNNITASSEEPIYFTRGDTAVVIKVVAEDAQSGPLSYEFLGSLQGGTAGAFTVDAQGGSASFTPGDGFAGVDTLSVRVRNTETDGFVDVNVDVSIRPVSHLISGPGVGSTSVFTNDNTPTFSYDAVSGPNEGTISGATFACKIDGNAMSNTACNTGSITTSALIDGEHTFTVKASKPNVNPDNLLASTTFTVDTVNPADPTLDGSQGLTKSNDPSWSFTLPEGTAECRLLSSGDPDPAWDDCTSPTEYTDLPDGPYTFEVRTLDAALNHSGTVSRSVLIDTVVDVTIDSAPTDGNLDGKPAIEFSSSEDPDVTYECRLFETAADPEDIPSFESCSSPEQLPLLDKNVSYTFEVKGTDEAGNTDTASAVWLQNNTAPGIVEPDETFEAGTIKTIALGGSDADSDVITYAITSEVTGGTLGAIDQDTGEVDFTAATGAHGTHTFTYSVSDARQGGTTAGTATVRIQPETAFVTTPVDPTNDATPTWTFSSPSGLTTFECSLDAGAWENCDGGSFTPASDLPDGDHTLEVRTTDAPLVDPTPASNTVTTDVTEPDVSITDTPVALSNDTTPPFEFESTDGTATFECKVDAGTFAACNSGDDIALQADGSHTFSVRAVDPAGNRTAVPAEYTWEVDATLPVVNLGGTPVDTANGPGEGKQTNAKRPVWYFERSDLNLDTAKVRCRIDAQAWLETCLSPFQPPVNLSDGTHTLHIEADDGATNVGALAVSFKVNTLAPSVAITEFPDSPSGPAATFEFTASTDLGPEGKFECRQSVNGGSPSAWSTCVTPLELTGLTSGLRKLEVRAVDSAGNNSVGAGVGSYTWSVIGGEPDTAITSSTKSGRNAAFGFNSPGNPLATFECSIDAGAFTACTSPKSYSSLSTGSHTFSVRATNQVGSTDSTPASNTWSVTAPAAPNTSITKQPANPTTDTGASFEFNSTESLVTFTCSVDGGAYSACTSPMDLTGLAVGDHTFSVKSTSTVSGITDASAASVAWTVTTPIIDEPDKVVCNPTAPNKVITNPVKLAPGVLASATVSHSSARVGQIVTVSLQGKKSKISKSLKSVSVISGGKTIATLKGKSWSNTFTVTDGQANGLVIKFQRKKGKAIKKPAAFTVKPACAA